MTISIKLPGEDWYGETHTPMEIDGGGILWIPDGLHLDNYTHHVSQEDEDNRDLFLEELIKAATIPLAKDDNDDSE